MHADFSLPHLWQGEGNGTLLQCSCLENSMDRGAWWAVVHGVARSPTWLSDFTFTFHFHALEKEMATPSSVLAWRIPGTGEPGGLPSLGSHRVGHDWSNLAAAPLTACQTTLKLTTLQWCPIAVEVTLNATPPAAAFQQSPGKLLPFPQSNRVLSCGFCVYSWFYLERLPNYPLPKPIFLIISISSPVSALITGSQLLMMLPSTGHLAMSGDIWSRHTWADSTTGRTWVEAKDATKYPTVPPTSKTRAAKNCVFSRSVVSDIFQPHGL